jgi:hypothetical protein
MCLEKDIRETKTLIDRDRKYLEATLNMGVEGMTLGELKQHLKGTDKIEHSLNKNLLRLERLEDLQKNNKSMEDY